MPREVSQYPTDGIPVTGTAISHLRATQADGAVTSWRETAELYWTLSGNPPLGENITIPPPPQGATTTLTSVYTAVEIYVSDTPSELANHVLEERITTSRVTLVEAVGTAYPATIIRTGYTHLDNTMISRNALDTADWLTESTTQSYWRTTTMVQVTTQPTPWTSE